MSVADVLDRAYIDDGGDREKCGEPLTSNDDSSLLEWRAFHPLFEEDGIVDQTVGYFKFSLQNGSDVLIHQEPRLAARIDSRGQCASNLADLGASITEQTSATGAVVWDSSVVVARLLDEASTSNPSYPAPSKTAASEDYVALTTSAFGDISERTVIELGSGAGFLSVVCWHLGARSVVASERNELMPLLVRNLRNNCRSNRDSRQCQAATESDKLTEVFFSEDDVSTAGSRSIQALPYMWGEPLPKEFTEIGTNFVVPCGVEASLPGGALSAKPPQGLLVLAVDCIYDEGAVLPLLDSVYKLLKLKKVYFVKGAATEAGYETALCCLEHTPAALVAVDSSYKRPKALDLFLSSLGEKGLTANEVSTSHLIGKEHYRESVRIWKVELCHT